MSGRACLEMLSKGTIRFSKALDKEPYFLASQLTDSCFARGKYTYIPWASEAESSHLPLFN